MVAIRYHVQTFTGHAGATSPQDPSDQNRRLGDTALGLHCKAKKTINTILGGLAGAILRRIGCVNFIVFFGVGFLEVLMSGTVLQC